MNRRALLAATATVGLSGCASLLSESRSTPGEEPTPAGKTTPSDTAPDSESTEAPPELESLWRYETGGTIDAVDGGTVFCREAFHDAEDGGEGRVVGIDAETGDLQWHYGFADGVLAYSPLTVDDAIYFGRGSDTPSGDGEIYALERDGTERWVEEETSSIHGRPHVADGTVYVASEVGVTYALDADTGDVHWKNEEIGTSPSPGTEIVAVDVVVYVDADRIYALDRDDGEVRWSVGNEDSTFGPHVSVKDSIAYVFGDSEDGVTAFEPDGTERWQKNLRNVGLDVCGDRVVVEAGLESTTMYGFDAATGEERWSVNDPGYDVAACTDDRLYAIESNDERLYAIDPTDGTEIWNESVGDGPLSSVWLVDGNDSVFVEIGDNALHQVNQNGDVTWSAAVDGSVRSVALEEDFYVGTSANVYRLPFE